METRVDDLRAKLEARRNFMSSTAFRHTANRLSVEAQYVVWRILGRSSSEEIVEGVAKRHFHDGFAAQPSKTEFTAAQAMLECLFDEIKDRFQLE